ncbi:MAG: hypothetical protein K0A99_02560 [Desulfoarculaceae bacterium]|nr:hypothetical protein [Desulfoarculaceae bacterium]
MKVDAVAVGPLDLASGLALLTSSQQQGFPWLSANLLDQQGLPLFQPLYIKKIGKIKAGIIGLTGAVSPLPPGVTLADWRVVFPALIEKIRPQCDILILLSSLSPAENQEIARQFPSLHLILAAGRQSGNMIPQQVNNTLITQTAAQGKYQGILSIDWHKSGRWEQVKGEELTELRNRLGALDWQLLRMRKREDLQQPEYLDKIKLVEKDRETVTRQIETIEKGLTTGLSGEQETACSLNHNFLALQRSLPEAPEITAIVTGIKQQIHDLHANRIGKKVQFPLVGHEGCKSCHPAQGSFWQETRHARAYQTLVDQKQAFNLTCLPCHVTSSPVLALSTDQLLSLPPTLQAVGCENCHTGPGGSHAGQPEQFQMTKQVAEKVCLSCHTQERDHTFDYQKKLALIACPTGQAATKGRRP